MKPIQYKLEKWTANLVLDRIKNCEVTQPPEEVNWFYTNTFYLDKRPFIYRVYDRPSWSSVYYCNHTKEINWVDYFLWKDGTNQWWVIFAYNNWVYSQVSMAYDSGILDFKTNSDSPNHFVLWKWINWPRVWASSVLSLTEWTASSDIDWPLVPWYAWWYIKFTYSWAQILTAWDYIQFTNGALKWCINKIEFVSWTYVFIIWTNIRWTVPKVWTTFNIYLKTNTTLWSNIVFAWSSWVYITNPDWYNMSSTIKVLETESPVLDICNYDWNIFVLTKNKLYFSRTTSEDNTNFYPMDYLIIQNWKCLFPIWKSLIVFAWENKLIIPINIWTVDYSYQAFDLYYDGWLYSKYSKIFTDQTAYILQSDRQLKEINIVQYNNYAYEIKVEDALQETSALFLELTDLTNETWVEYWNQWWVYMSSTQRYLYIIAGWKVYKYDKLYKLIIEDTYTRSDMSWWLYTITQITNKYLIAYDSFIYKFSKNKDTLQWDSPFTNTQKNPVEQSVSFSLSNWYWLVKPYILRTTFKLFKKPCWRHGCKLY